MIFACPSCKANGSCKDHPLVTCKRCGLTYRDDSDWSGDAHSNNDCADYLAAQLAAARLAGTTTP